MASSMASELELVKAALREILSVTSSADRRRRAHQIIEEFKETSLHCADIGLALYTDKLQDETVRHIGLTFIEEYFKNKWNELSKEEHIKWKEKTLMLMKDLDFGEPGHIKECIARLVVELAKREWPQNWQNLLERLGEIQTVGAVQLEVTLLVFLRLGEDVMLSLDPHLHQQRRRGIEQALNANMENLFKFFISTLKNHVGAWKESKQPVNRRLAEASLFTLTAYLNNVPLEHVFANDSLLLQMLCRLLEEPELQLAASECLVTIAERRKDKADARLPLLILISDDAMGLFIEVARKSCLAGAEEKNYKFLKKLCDLIVALGTCQLADLWGNERGISTRPNGFERYLKLILDFLNHPSQVICHKVVMAFAAFLKHDHISKDDILIDSIPHFLTAFGTRLFKHGDPSEDNHPSCEYSLLDHDSSEEFLTHFSKLRSVLATTIRDCTTILPLEAFLQVYKWIMKMKSNIDIQDAVEWDALVVFTETVMTRFWKSEKIPENVDVIEDQGQSVQLESVTNELLQSLIQTESEVLEIMVSIFACLQSFFPFFKRSQALLLASVEKIVLTFTRYPSTPTDKEVVNLRRQATACFVNLCKEDSAHLMPYFDDFRNYVDKLQQEKALSSQEQITIMEGLLILNNGMPDSKRQAYICYLLSILEQVIAEDNFRIALTATENFITFIGLTEAPNENALAIENRFKLSHLTQLIQAMVRRVSLSEAEKNFVKSSGGFFKNSSEFSWISRLASFIPIVVRIIRHLGFLWSPEIAKLINKDYIAALQLNESDKSLLLGQHVVKDAKEAFASSSSIVTKTNTFLHGLHNTSYTLLGLFGGLLEEYFYNYNGIVQIIVNDVMASWNFLPKYRFIIVFKYFLKPFVNQCPSSCYQRIIGSVFSVALENMLKVLTEQWSDFSGENYRGKIMDSTQVDEENITDAVVAERLMFSFSREYIEMLVSFFFHKKRETDRSENVPPENPASELGELGKFFLNCEATNKQIVTTFFTSFVWPDTVSVNKVARVIPFLVNFIQEQVTFDCKIDASLIDHLFTCILKGMEIHGAELSAQGSLLTSALLMYLKLRESYPSLVRIMLMVPSCKKEQLMKFDMDVFSGDCTLTEKKKREYFKKFISDAFGKNVSELYKSDIHIKDLPPLAPRRKPKSHQSSFDEGPNDLTGLFGES